MCLILIANDCYAGYRLIVAANRDEYHARATAAVERWRDHPTIVGGRDLESVHRPEGALDEGDDADQPEGQVLALLQVRDNLVEMADVVGKEIEVLDEAIAKADQRRVPLGRRLRISL